MTSKFRVLKGLGKLCFIGLFQRRRIVAFQPVFHIVGFKFYVLLYDSSIAVMLGIRWKNRFINFNVFCPVNFYLLFLAIFMPFFGFFLRRISLVFRMSGSILGRPFSPFSRFISSFSC